MSAQDAVADRVEGSVPDPVTRSGQKIADSLDHLLRRFICESEKQNRTRWNSLLEQPGHTISEGAGFSAAGSRDHQGGAWGRLNCSELLLIEGGGKINAANRPYRVQCIGACHVDYSEATLMELIWALDSLSP